MVHGIDGKNAECCDIGGFNLDNTNERIKLIHDYLAQSVEDYGGDYELPKIDSDDAYWLISTIKQQQQEIKELISLNLWSARRLHTLNKTTAYDEIEKITGKTYERL